MEKFDADRLRKNLQMARIENEISQEEMATKLNITQSQYSKLENGTNSITMELLWHCRVVSFRIRIKVEIRIEIQSGSESALGAGIIS